MIGFPAQAYKEIYKQSNDYPQYFVCHKYEQDGSTIFISTYVDDIVVFDRERIKVI